MRSFGDTPFEDKESQPRLKRRDALRLGVLAGGAALVPGCSQVVRRLSAPAPHAPLEMKAGQADPLIRLLNRVAFGPAPADLARVAQVGAQAYIEEQLNPDEDEDKVLAWRLHGVEVFEFSAPDLRDLPQNAILRQMSQSSLLRATYSRHQLRERMVDFWSNHFNIYARKWPAAYLKPLDEVQVIRGHALGRFPDLLSASAHSPAMLSYLDNSSNKRGVPNENYARELMELHTLGVYGGYTQKDVHEVARCLSGWGLEDRFLHRRDTARFDASQHDDGPKLVLGTRIAPGGGEHDLAQVLEVLSTHPATAEHLSSKLCQYFLGRDDANCKSRLASIYGSTRGDIRAMLHSLLLEENLQQAPEILKRPFDFAVSALRVLEADTDGGWPLQAHLERMGQPLNEWPQPDGYPSSTSSWSGSLLARWNFALALCAGQIGGTTLNASLNLPGQNTPNGKTIDELTKRILAHRGESLDALALTLRRHASGASERAWSETLALLLASPQFQWR